MAENFNNCLTSIGTKIQSKIPLTRMYDIDDLKHPTLKPFNITLNSRKN